MACESLDKEYWDYRTEMSDTWVKVNRIYSQGGPKTPEDMQLLKKWLKMVKHMHELDQKHEDCLKRNRVRELWDESHRIIDLARPKSEEFKRVLHEYEMCMLGHTVIIIGGIPDINLSPCDLDFSEEAFWKVLKNHKVA